MKKVVSISFEKGLLNQLKAEAIERDMSLSALLRQASSELLICHGFNKPKSKAKSRNSINK